MSDNLSAADESVLRGTDDDVRKAIDADYSGHLATGLFVGVILILLVVIYAFASAA